MHSTWPAAHVPVVGLVQVPLLGSVQVCPGAQQAFPHPCPGGQHVLLAVQVPMLQHLPPQQVPNGLHCTPPQSASGGTTMQVPLLQ
jgi:hypothetical protein